MLNSFFLKKIMVLGIFCLFLLPNANSFAAPAETFEGECESCNPPLTGTYVWWYYKGHKLTTFYPDDDNYEPIEEWGHVTFLIPTGGNGYQFPNLPDNLDGLAQLNFEQIDGNIIVNTDAPIEVVIVDLTTGDLLSPTFFVANSKTIDISSLSIGCKYSLLVSQKIITTSVRIIKLPIANYNFCKQ